MSNFIIISGSHRAEGESNHVGAWFRDVLASRGHEAELLELADLNLPFWDEGMWGKDPLAAKWADLWAPVAAKLAAADGFVLIAPEYHGMAPSMLKNFLLLASAKEVGHKAAMIVGVTSGLTNGAYPVMELRGGSAKNNRLCWVPDHVIVRRAAEVLKTPEEDTDTANFARYALTLLEDYTTALKHVRDAGHMDYKTYPFGM
ncbi:MAG: NADPH-dependent oxidoreductase [Alphaproteobacteria bacterium CG_4_10_14_0_8_um_filter_53_9]|nr:MAG: NADPH-dependent oxidoreductase [Alphaproteobacteria bacterium CG_4_10_14_0_8_um_filter_53_9]